MITIRLKRGGKKRNPCYRIVAAERAMKRDGRNIDDLGYYHPCAQPAIFEIDVEKLKRFIAEGAEMSPTVASFVKSKGLLAENSGE
jgi:small subunit ribosomal protein S16